ncbi:SRPBCC family protein [Actinophytocola xanthii]|uniref:Activator of Hsp90 ATPase 1 family protein n=1 Tax=Actinophytocola xanthii TaxID=1912961 RepID=A0A1Q8CPW6_9PSEU|nr:SRPBCC domain-containing protein [Actinophytocola xanthii]OLF16396.1 activator of Hsp90 ATPase 1 family protein [Actinophytocola xanthii]
MVGQTKDVGWNIGVSRTVPHPVERVWQLLTSPRGLRLWLGDTELGTRKGDPYRTTDGTVGELRSRHENDRVRLTWRPATWDHDTTLQVAVRPRGETRTMLRFHQEWLADAQEREHQRDHWRAVMDKVVEALG